ncbi:O-antigen ligase [Faecalicatena contorta]|uniref:O-antigen ligase n=2 Tax=Faecalicatena contorta TaxID=39482 RepID=A0A316A3P2_9FIRM|nr:O-antigen ligase [Faecalicatena contorta]SUQ13116.1 O-antigen ligase [Faecalicatena contorta]
MVSLLILPFILPDIFTRNETIGSVVQIWKIMAGIWAIYRMIFSKKIAVFPIILTMFYGSVIISGLCHGIFIMSNFTGLALLWIFFYLTYTPEIRMVFYKVYLDLMKLLIYGNFLSMILFPNGLYASSVYQENWLLGYKNIFVIQIIPALTILFLSYIEKKEKIDWKVYLLIVVSLLSMIASFSTTGLICILVFIIGVILITMNKFPKWLGITNSFVVYMILNIFLIDGTLLEKLGNIITGVLQKSLTLTGRTAIWKSAIKQISKHWLFGGGRINSDAFALGFRITHAHNLLLNFLLLGGIICIALLIIAFVYIDRKRKKCQDNRIDIVVFMMMIIFIMGFSESLLLGSSIIFPVLILGDNILSNGKKSYLVSIEKSYRREYKKNESRVMYTL